MRFFKQAITHNNQRCDIRHVEIDTFDGIPDELKLKAHAACFHKGKLLLVNHAKWNVWGIPGGTREEDESIEETLKREVQEESNCRVVDMLPIAYQEVCSPDGKKHYRLNYICEVVPIAGFTKDPTGCVDKIAWIDPKNFEEYVEKKLFKKVVLQRAVKLFHNSICKQKK